MAGGQFTLTPYRGGHSVLCDGIPVGWRKDVFKAERDRARLEGEGRLKGRSCLRCGMNFLSTGAHHRMCDGCRLAVRGEYEGAV